MAQLLPEFITPRNEERKKENGIQQDIGRYRERAREGGIRAILVRSREHSRRPRGLSNDWLLPRWPVAGPVPAFATIETGGRSKR